MKSHIILQNENYSTLTIQIPLYRVLYYTLNHSLIITK